jgi:hypothetical protein
VAALAFLGIFGYAIFASFQPEPVLGEAVSIAGQEHIPLGQPALDHNTDPPTSGQHYDTPAAPGFYEVAPPDEQLVHNLEHGYVVVYFSCSDLAEAVCAGLQDEIRSAISGKGVSRFTGTAKLIAVPRPAMANRITYTSWGRLHRADAFDERELELYIQQNLDQAPEPFAQ